MAKFIQKKFKPPIIVAFGNPLLDICARQPPAHIFEKYHIKIDGQIELQDEEYISFFKDVACVTQTGLQWPGGSAQNTLRLFQWLIGSPGYTVLFGAVGVDDNGKFLEEYVSKSGVITKFIHHEEHHTGTCLTFIRGETRSLVAHIGAANFCSIDVDLPEVREILQDTQMVYIEGFFITHDFQLTKRILQICHENETRFVINLSAPYVCEKFSREMVYLVEQADIICGNACEFVSLCKAMNFTVESSVDSVTVIQKHRQNLNQDSFSKKQINKTMPRLLQSVPLIIITDGKNDIIVAEGLTKPPDMYSVPVLPRCQLMDTTGAGDAFMAGFLAAAFCDFNIEVCVEWGCKTAASIIRNIGVHTPNTPPSWVSK